MARSLQTRFRRIDLLALFLLTCFLLKPAPGQNDEAAKLSLVECENLAFRNNPLIRDALVDLRFSEAKLTQTRNKRILPTATARNVWGPAPRSRGIFNDYGVLNSPDTSGIGTLGFFTQIDVELEQPIYTFGKYAGLASAGFHTVRATEATVRQRENEVRLQVRQLYWGLVLGRELLAVIKDAQSEIRKAENNLQEKLDQGSEDVSQTDLFKLQLFKYEIAKRRRDAVDKLELARATLKLVVGLSETDHLEIETEFIDPVETELAGLDSYVDIALTDQPKLEKLRAEENAKSARIDVARSQYYPQLFVASDISFNYAQNRFDPSNPFRNSSTNFFRPILMAEARINLNYVQTRDKIRIAQAEYELAAQKERALAEEIGLEVEKAYLELMANAANMKESRKALRASNNWLRSAAMIFDLGVGEVSAFINAYKANAAMKAEHLQNIFEYNSAVAKMSHVIGHDLLADTVR